MQIHPRKFKALRPPQTDGGRDSGNRQNDSSRTSPAGRRNLQAEAGRTLGETNGQQERQHEDGKRSFNQVRKDMPFILSKIASLLLKKACIDLREVNVLNI